MTTEAKTTKSATPAFLRAKVRAWLLEKNPFGHYNTPDEGLLERDTLTVAEFVNTIRLSTIDECALLVESRRGGGAAETMAWLIRTTMVDP